MCDRWLRTVINLLCAIMNPSELVPGMSELCTKVENWRTLHKRWPYWISIYSECVKQDGITKAQRIFNLMITEFYTPKVKHIREGVGIILDKERAKCLMGYLAISDRVILVRLKGQPFDISIIIVYAPTSESSEEEIVAFYNNLEEAKSHCRSQEIVIIRGDLNAKVGQEADGEVIGKHGLGIQNECGERWAQWCKTNGQIFTNTWFKLHQRRLWTWNSPGGQYKNQIDYITINKRFKNAVQQTKTYPGADCGSDHRLLFCKVKIKLKKLQQGKATPKLN